MTNTFAKDKSNLVPTAKKPLKILFLGGTGFLGPHTVSHAIARGHEVTLFNRGRSKEGLFPELETIIGDRDPKIGTGLDNLNGRHWDCVIDTSGYVPRIVDASTKQLQNQCDQYLFISSISVYKDFNKIGLNEESSVVTLKDKTVESINGETYGPLKAYSEQAAEVNFNNKTTIIRPGLIVGPRDRTDRYTYWPVRVAKGGEVLSPGDGKDFVQYIDVRDLGAFIIHCLEQKTMGIFNATSAMNTETSLDMLNFCKQASGSNASFTWVDADFLEEKNVTPWSNMPVWIPRQSEMAGLSQVSVNKAERQGLVIRSRTETVQDTLTWFGGLSEARRKSLRAGISKQKEAEILTAWHTAESPPN
ncbi:MAG: epimerase [Gammaproteobacteria bacterium]|nr:MAG: epimerase [Gammaproteobacteria bacterium]